MAATTLNVIVQGLLTGLVYGLMALGLSVIFGVMRVVNFAHGEFTVVAMYAAFILFEILHLDPLIALLPVAAAVFRGRLPAAADPDQSLYRPSRTRAVHSAGRARDRDRQRPAHDLRSRRAADQPVLQLRQLRRRGNFHRQGQGAGGDCRPCGRRGIVPVFSLHPHRNRDPRLRRQSHRAPRWSASMSSSSTR